MPRIPGGGSWNVAICCGPASSLFVGSVFQYGSHWFASGATCRPSRIVPRWHGMTYREYAAMRRYAPVRGFRYGSLWFGSPEVRGASLCFGPLRYASPGPASTAPPQCAGMFRYVSPCFTCRPASWCRGISRRVAVWRAMVRIVAVRYSTHYCELSRYGAVWHARAGVPARLLVRDQGDPPSYPLPSIVVARATGSSSICFLRAIASSRYAAATRCCLWCSWNRAR